MAGANPQLVVNIIANTQALLANLAAGRGAIEAYGPTIAKMTDTWNRNSATVVQNAATITAAVNQVGASTLTAADAAKNLRILNAGMEQLRATGQPIPPLMDQIAASLKRGGNDADSFAAKLKAIGPEAKQAGMALSVGITAPIVGAATASVAFASDFQTQMVRVQTLAGASAAEIAKMGQAVLQLAPQVGVGPADLAKGLFVVESAGYTGADALNILTVAAKMTALGMGETSETARSLIGAMFAYKNQNLDAAAAGDILTKTVQLGNMKIDELVPALARVNPVAAAMGVKFQDVAAAVATFTHMGAPAEVATMGLRTVLGSILKDTSKTEAGFHDLAATLNDSSISMGNFRHEIADKGLTQALLDLMDKANAAGEKGVDALVKIFPNVRGLVVALADAKVAGTQYLGIAEKIGQASGVVATGFETTQQTFTQRWKDFKATAEVLGITVGSELLPHLQHLIDFLSKTGLPIIERLVKAFTELPAPVKLTALALAGLVAGAGPALYLFGGIAQGVTALVAILPAATTLTAAFGVAIDVATGPIGLIALAVGGLVAAVVHFRNQMADLEAKPVAGPISAAGKAMEATAAQARALSAASGPLAAGTQLTITNLNEFGSVVGLAGSGMKTAGDHADFLKGKLDALRTEATIPLTEEQKTQIVELEKLHVSLKDIAEATGTNILAVKNYEASYKSAEAAQKKFGVTTADLDSATGGLQATIDSMDGTVVEAIKYYLAMGISQGSLATAYGLTAAQVKAVAIVVKQTAAEMASDQKELAKVAKQMATEFIAGNKEIATAQTNLVEFTAQQTMTSTDYQVVKIWEVANQQIAAFKGLKEQRAAYTAKVIALADEQTQALYVDNKALMENSAASLQEQADKAWTTYEAMKAAPAEFSAATIEKFHAIAKAAQDDADGTKHAWVGAFTAIGQQIPQLIQQALTGGGGFAGAAKAIGSMSGEQIGKGLVTHLTEKSPEFMASGLGKMFGAAIPVLGSLAGPLISAIIGLFDHSIQDLKNVGAQYGLALTDSMVKTIKDSMSALHLTEQAATIFNASQLFPTVDATNFADALKLTRDAFSMIETKQLSVAQGAQVVDDMWAKLAKQGTDSVGLLSDKMMELIKLDQQFGTNSAQIASYLKTQYGDVVSGFNDIVKGYAGPIQAEWDSLIAEINKVGGGIKGLDTADSASVANYTKGLVTQMQDLQAQIATMLARGIKTPQQQQQFDDLQRQLGTLKQQLNGLDADMGALGSHLDSIAATGSSDFQHMGDMAALAFAAARAGGATTLDALNQIGPSLDALSTLQKELGLQASGAFQHMMDVRGVLEANAGLSGSIDGLTHMMQGLENSGMMTQGTFAIMAAEILRQFSQMHDAGISYNDSLDLQQQNLQILYELQKRYGFQVDGATQSLLDQAKQAGVVSDANESMNQQMIDGLKSIDDDLQALLTGFGIDLPAKLAGMATAAQAAAQQTNQALQGIKAPDVTIRASWSIPDLPKFPMSDQVGFGGGQAAGGDFLVTRPTLFLAGEAGVERATFSGAGNVGNGNTGSSGTPDITEHLRRISQALRDQPRDIAAAVSDAIVLGRGGRRAA